MSGFGSKWEGIGTPGETRQTDPEEQVKPVSGEYRCLEEVGGFVELGELVEPVKTRSYEDDRRTLQLELWELEALSVEEGDPDYGILVYSSRRDERGVLRLRDADRKEALDVLDQLYMDMMYLDPLFTLRVPEL